MLDRQSGHGSSRYDDRDKERGLYASRKLLVACTRVAPPDASQRMRYEQAIITIIAI
jgi:hypothetical protein